MITSLYADGGVIASNPSVIGGTYAYRLVDECDQPVLGEGHAIAAVHFGGLVTNNQTEMLALLRGLEKLPVEFAGTIHSDSNVTLGRIFRGEKWNNVPEWMHQLWRQQRQRFVNWEQVKYVLLDGHPTKAQLAAGIGKRGHPVSIHNVWCDHACTEAGRRFLEEIGRNIPSTVELELAGA